MYLVGACGELIIKYFYGKLPLYLALLLLFGMGAGFGALTPQKLSVLQREDLSAFLQGIYTTISENNRGAAAGPGFFQHSVIDNVLKTAGLLFVLGLTVIGAPLILGIVFIRGFVLGFTVGFLIQETSTQGLILSAAAVLPHNLLAVPAVLIGAGGALSFAATALKTLCGLSQKRIYGQLASTGFISLCSALLLFLASLIETYFTPVLINLTSRFLV